MTESPSGTHLLARLDAEPCVRPACGGRLERGRYKGTGAVVCTDCETPAVRVWAP